MIPLACDAPSASETWMPMSRIVEFHRVPNAFLQAGSFELLHHDERMSVHVFDIVNGTNSGMIQARRGPCFPLKAAKRLLVSNTFSGINFRAPQSGSASRLLPCRPRPCHRRQFLHDPVVRYGLAQKLETDFPLADTRGELRSGQPAASTSKATMCRKAIFSDT